MATEGCCPVCGESFADTPDRCFRCETSLAAWWRFEDATRGLAREAPAPWPRRRVVVAAALVLGVLAVALLLRPRIVEAPRPPALPAAPAAPSVVTTPERLRPQSVRYTVQPGDSPWRIAAALTGRGHRWRELWPGAAPALFPGMVLDVPLQADPPVAGR